MDAHQKVELQNDRQTAQARDNSRSKAYENYPENDFSAKITLNDGQTSIVTTAYHDRLQWAVEVEIPEKSAAIADIQTAIREQTDLNISEEIAWGEGCIYLELN